MHFLCQSTSPTVAQNPYAIIKHSVTFIINSSAALIPCIFYNLVSSLPEMEKKYKVRKARRVNSFESVCSQCKENTGI